MVMAVLKNPSQLGIRNLEIIIIWFQCWIGVEALIWEQNFEGSCRLRSATWLKDGRQVCGINVITLSYLILKYLYWMQNWQHCQFCVNSEMVQLCLNNLSVPCCFSVGILHLKIKLRKHPILKLLIWYNWI